MTKLGITLITRLVWHWQGILLNPRYSPISNESSPNRSLSFWGPGVFLGVFRYEPLLCLLILFHYAKCIFQLCVSCRNADHPTCSNTVYVHFYNCMCRLSKGFRTVIFNSLEYSISGTGYDYEIPFNEINKKKFPFNKINKTSLDKCLATFS